VQYGAHRIQLGIGDATAMRGQFIGGYDANIQLVAANGSQKLTYGILWHCSVHSAWCSRSRLGPGVVYGVDSHGDAVGDDERDFRSVTGDFGVLGNPMLWRNGRSISLSPGHEGAAYAISEDGTIVGTFRDRSDGAVPGATRGFIASVRHAQARALDPLVVNLGARRIVGALGVSDGGRILVVVQPEGIRNLPPEHAELGILVPVAR
jgi:hypothetical protein